MSRHRLIVVLTAIALLVMGLVATPVTAEEMPERPIRGFLTGSAFNSPPDPGVCQPGDLVLTRTQVTGELAHLGLTESLEFWHCGRFGEFGELVLDGAATFEAANGDRLEGDYVGVLIGGDDIRAPLEWSISGGTGRFTNASGMITLDVLVLPGPDGVSVEVTVDGTISY